MTDQKDGTQRTSEDIKKDVSLTKAHNVSQFTSLLITDQDDAMTNPTSSLSAVASQESNTTTVQKAVTTSQVDRDDDDFEVLYGKRQNIKERHRLEKKKRVPYSPCPGVSQRRFQIARAIAAQGHAIQSTFTRSVPPRASSESPTSDLPFQNLMPSGQVPDSDTAPEQVSKSDTTAPSSTILKPDCTAPSLQLVFVLDASASMADHGRAKALAQTVNQILDQQRPSCMDTDQLSMAFFGEGLHWIQCNAPLKTAVPLVLDRSCTKQSVLTQDACIYRPNMNQTFLYDAVAEVYQLFKDASNLLLYVVTDGKDVGSSTSQEEAKEFIHLLQQRPNSQIFWTQVQSEDTNAQADGLGLSNSSNGLVFINRADNLGTGFMNPDVDSSSVSSSCSAIRMKSSSSHSTSSSATSSLAVSGMAQMTLVSTDSTTQAV